MAGDLTDDAVAEILKREARAKPTDYSYVGLSSLPSKRPTTSLARKPNTKFLRGLLRETDSHNAALKAKEEREARARAQELRRHDSRLVDSRQRVDKHVSKRRRVERHEDHDVARPRRRLRHERDSDDLASQTSGQRENTSNEAERYYDRSSRENRKRRRDHSHRHANTNERTRDSDEDRATYREFRSHRGHRHRRSSRSTSRDRSRMQSPIEGDHRRPTGKSRRRRLSSPESTSLTQRGKHKEQKALPSGARGSSADSDPLEAIVGPLPPAPGSAPKRRGRGAHNTSSAMDARFSTSYIPASDVRPDSADELEHDDWELGLEAVRDRAKWKAQGAERLRAAGFTDNDIARWENSGREKNEEDVRWAKQGESREWDHGKLLDDATGEVTVRPKWGRLSRD
jgi:hypothetical protein